MIFHQFSNSSPRKSDNIRKAETIMKIFFEPLFDFWVRRIPWAIVFLKIEILIDFNILKFKVPRNLGTNASRTNNRIISISLTFDSKLDLFFQLYIKVLNKVWFIAFRRSYSIQVGLCYIYVDLTNSVFNQLEGGGEGKLVQILIVFYSKHRGADF